MQNNFIYRTPVQIATTKMSILYDPKKILLESDDEIDDIMDEGLLMEKMRFFEFFMKGFHHALQIKEHLFKTSTDDIEKDFIRLYYSIFPDI